jgi:hypothetical protein
MLRTQKLIGFYSRNNVFNNFILLPALTYIIVSKKYKYPGLYLTNKDIIYQIIDLILSWGEIK